MGGGEHFWAESSLLKYYELLGQIQVLGVTCKENIFKSYGSYPYINKDELLNLKFDFLIIMSNKFYLEILKDCIGLGIPEKKILSSKVLHIPYFDFEKYKALLENPVTIFSNACWGGFCYNSLGLQFSSPFINLYLSENDYLKFLSNPKTYTMEKLVLQKYDYHECDNAYYPICSLGDITLYMLHYHTLKEATEAWNRRVQRINWDNILVEINTDSADTIKHCLSLPYKKKAIFTSLDYHSEQIIQCDFYKMGDRLNVPYHTALLGTANGQYYWYDLLELLYSGKIIYRNTIVK